jgi:hypothetical protein
MDTIHNRSSIDQARETAQKMTTKTLEHYLSLPYRIELIPDEDSFWFAQIPELPSCMTQGASREKPSTWNLLPLTYV